MQQIESIIAYLTKSLPGQQRQAFEQELAGNTSLQEAVADYRLILEGFRGMRQEYFHREVRQWHEADIPEATDEKIMAYLQDRLDEQERQEFEKEMAQDAEFAQRVATYRTMLQGFRGLEHEDFQAQATIWAQDLPLATKTPRPKKVIKLLARQPWWQYAAAAVVVALITAMIWLWAPIANGGNPTAFRLENYIAPGANALVRGTATTLSEAARFFAKTEYEQALNTLGTITADDSLYLQARFLAGHSHYQLTQYSQAIAAFDEVLTPAFPERYNLRTVNRDNAAWTRILAQMALTTTGADPGILRQMLTDFLATANRSDTYYAKALALEQRLDNFW